MRQRSRIDWKLPINRFTAMRLQKRIRLGEMPRSEKAVMGGKRRRMRRLQHQMPSCVDKSRLLLGIGAPEHENDGFTFVVHLADDRIGETFPAFALMRGRLRFLHGQHTVEEKHALLGPMFKEA